MEETPTEIEGTTMQQQERDVTAVEEEIRQEIASRSSPRSDNYVIERIERDRELEILRRERDLMQRELKILRR